MDKEDRNLMFGPLKSFNLDRATNEIEVDMGAMTDLVRALKEVDVSPEKVDQNKHGGVGTATGKNLKLSDNIPRAGEG